MPAYYIRMSSVLKGALNANRIHRAKPVPPRNPDEIRACSKCRYFIAAKKKELARLAPGQIGWCRSRRVVQKPLWKMPVWDDTADLAYTSRLVDKNKAIADLLAWNRTKDLKLKAKGVEVEWNDERGCPIWQAR